jgi:hypothetical protein
MHDPNETVALKAASASVFNQPATDTDDDIRAGPNKELSPVMKTEAASNKPEMSKSPLDETFPTTSTLSNQAEPVTDRTLSTYAVSAEILLHTIDESETSGACKYADP